ncbi:sodium/solute symporter [Segeticoccus rhizosphaerae]|uniref:sodium/solute symporter n=1 Tax=Segeticoccus rhizosphaerae TaxID=1104777 RepID=UPI0010BFD9EF|nr:MULTISPECIES: cation acetate symporter [Intrasporangiaceae]
MSSHYGIVAIVAVCALTAGVGAFGLRLSRTTSDFYVASRAVSPRLNASAIGGEYLSAASFLGIAGLIYSRGADMLWFPVGYTVGYLVLLVLIAAPLRRSGAYTVPDFAEARLDSPRIRRLCSVLVIGIGWLYLLPQFQGAGLALHVVTGAPAWVGGLIVAVVVLLSVVAGGMRSITFVQAVQYWLKLTAICIPAFVLLMLWLRQGQPAPVVLSEPGGGGWARPLSGFGGQDHPTYWTYSTLLALCLGTMGLPHVIVRFYTNPDGHAARRTTSWVIGLLAAFYVFTPLYGVWGRVWLPQLPHGLHPDSVVLLLPSAASPTTLGDVLSALLAGGAFAAFLSTASGLTISVAGVLDQDLLRPRLHAWTGGDAMSVQGFRVAAVLGILVPYGLSLAGASVALASAVGLAFAVAASTFCPLLVLGVWWRRLSTVGAAAGLGIGGTLALLAVSTTVLFGVPAGWPGALLSQPAAWTVPITFLVTIVVSLATPDRVPQGTGRMMVLLHGPEGLVLPATRGG